MAGAMELSKPTLHSFSPDFKPRRTCSERRSRGVSFVLLVVKEGAVVSDDLKAELALTVINQLGRALLRFNLAV
jgi:hypothetical protein